LFLDLFSLQENCHDSLIPAHPHVKGTVETAELLTPRALVQPLPLTQGSISSLRSKRQKLFTPIPDSTSNAVDQEAGSLGSEFMKHGKRISALGHVLKFRLHESPGSPARQDTLCNVLALDSLPNHEYNSHMDLDGSGRKRRTEENVRAEHALSEKKAKGPRSPTSQKQLPCVSLSSRMAEENQSDDHDSGQSLGDDYNKVHLPIRITRCFGYFNVDYIQTEISEQTH
jgi:hypothetical protein